MVKKIVLVTLSVFFLVFPSKILSADEFQTDVNVSYKIRETGITEVIHEVTLKNLFSNFYPTNYTLKLDNIHVQNAKASQEGKTLNLTQKTEGSMVLLSVQLDKPVTGKDKSQTFDISFDEPNLAVRSGEVWEIAIPRISDISSFHSYWVTLSVPESLGGIAYISPAPFKNESQGANRLFTFPKESVAKTGISAGFGQFQVFSFTLNYHLENPLERVSYAEVAIPPDTSFQKISYGEISPGPENVSVDSDGNWLANFKLAPRARIDIKATGSVNIFPAPRELYQSPPQELTQYLKESDFWQTNDPSIQKAARGLNGPKAIYDFVSQTLTYNQDRVRPNVERLGAKEALQNPKNAICMEYTDLFIALARARGIPAREINGFAYTENPEVQPLSLVADVLHSWPEYWDESKKSWIPVDPTWGSTTGGVDYFTKLDLRHFTFVIHGQDPVKPYPPGSYKLGSNPQKDVFVSFGQPLFESPHVLRIEANPLKGLPFTAGKFEVLVTNPGPSARYGEEVSILFDNRKVKSELITVLPPYAKHTLLVEVPFSFLGQNTPEKMEILVGDSKIQIPTFKNRVILYNLIVIFLLFLIFLSILLTRIKKLTIATLGVSLKLYANKLRFNKKNPTQ